MRPTKKVIFSKTDKDLGTDLAPRTKGCMHRSSYASIHPARTSKNLPKSIEEKSRGFTIETDTVKEAKDRW